MDNKCINIGIIGKKKRNAQEMVNKCINIGIIGIIGTEINNQNFRKMFDQIFKRSVCLV